MYCPTCQQSNLYLVDQCQHCDTDLGPSRQETHIGAQFVYANASPAVPILIKVDEEYRMLTEPTIFSRYEHELDLYDLIEESAKSEENDKIEETQADTWYPHKLTKLKLPDYKPLSLTTDRKIYKKGDEAKVFVVAPQHSNHRIRLEIRLTGQQIYKTTLLLNQRGIALFRYQIADEGEYEAVATPLNETKKAASTFTCAAFSLSPFLATLRQYAFKAETLTAKIDVKSASVPYTGSVDIEIVMNGRTVARSSAKVINGQLLIEEEIGQYYADHSNLTLNLMSDEGHSASITLQNVGGSSRDQVNLAQMPNLALKATLSPQSLNDKPHRGLYFQDSNLPEKPPQGQPWEIEAIVTDAGKLTILAPIKKLLIHIISPSGRRFENLVFDDLKVGTEIMLPPLGEKAHQFVAIGAIFQDSSYPPYESFATLIAPQHLSPSLTGPEVAKPGSLVEVELRSNRAASALMLVYDARLEHESPLPKLSKSTFEYLKAFSRKARATAAKEVRQEIQQSELNRLNLRQAWEAFRASQAYGGEMFDFLMESEAIPRPMMRSMARMPMAAAMTGAVETLPEMALATRESFPEVIFCDLIEIDQYHRQVIKIGDQIGTWRCKAYLFSEGDWAEVSHDISSELDLYSEIDVPAIAGEKDEVWGKAVYHTVEPATLTITTPNGATTHEVEGDGLVEFPITGPGEILTDIKTQFDQDKGLRVIPPPGRETVTVSRLTRLKPGDSLSASRIVVYPSESELLAETIQSLIRYPFG